jgi:hypothetical protein
MLLYLVHLQKVMDLQVQSFLRRFPAKNGGHKILWSAFLLIFKDISIYLEAKRCC